MVLFVVLISVEFLFYMLFQELILNDLFGNGSTLLDSSCLNLLYILKNSHRNVFKSLAILYI